MKRLLALLALAISPAHAGESASLSGSAENANGGAVIVADDGRVIYVDGLGAWPTGTLGTRIEASGTLTEDQRIPLALVDENGAYSAGTNGPQTILLNPVWRRLP